MCCLWHTAVEVVEHQLVMQDQEKKGLHLSGGGALEPARQWVMGLHQGNPMLSQNNWKVW